MSPNAVAPHRVASAVRCRRLVGRTKISYSRIWLWLHCAAFLYSTTDLPVGDRRPPGPRSAPLATKAPLGSARFLPRRSVRRPGSLAAAKRRPSCIVWDSIRIRERLQRVAKQFAGPTTGTWASRCLLDHGRSDVALRLWLVLCRGRRPETSTHSVVSGTTRASSWSSTGTER
jgi:hypothetical protein